MARHYSTKYFFRQMPNTLLARFFQGRGLFGDLDFAIMKDGNPNDLFAAWLKLPEEQRKNIDAEFREIFDVGCEKGFRAIIDEATWQKRGAPEELAAFVENLSGLPNHYHRAMVTFLDHTECWRGATLFYHADSLSYWRKRKCMGNNTAAVDESSINQLAKSIRDYFHRTEGRGNNCVVEPFRRGELDYFFAYPEDYSQQSMEWVDGEFGRRPHNPAFEIVFVYSQKNGTLDLNFQGTHKADIPLQQMFAQEILKLEELPPDPKDKRVYDLNPLQKKSFNFTYALGSGIEKVVVKKLRLSSQIVSGDRITLEADTGRNQDAVYVLLEKVGNSIPLQLYSVTQVEIAATIKGDQGKPSKTVSFRITHPNSCTLKYDETGSILRQMLEASGIEPKIPALAEVKELAEA